eukprot:jgi/Mesvir1/12303/Mv26446-RA.1
MHRKLYVPPLDWQKMRALSVGSHWQNQKSKLGNYNGSCFRHAWLEHRDSRTKRFLCPARKCTSRVTACQECRACFVYKLTGFSLMHREHDTWEYLNDAFQ